MAISRAQAEDLVQKMQDAGYPADEIHAQLDRVGVQGANEAMPAGPLRTAMTTPAPGARISQGEKEMSRSLGQGAAMAIGGALGGPLAETALGPVLGSLPAETIGTGGGIYTGGRLTQVPPKEAALNAGLGGAGALAIGAGARGLTRLSSRMAGISPEARAAAESDPTVLNRPSNQAELDLARRVEANTDIQGSRTTQPHTDYNWMLGQKATTRVDAYPILDAFFQQVSGGDHPILRASDKQVIGMADRFTKRVGSDGKISLGDLDAYIRENFTDPLKGAYSRGSEAETVKRLMSVRGDIASHLYQSIGPGAASAQATTSDMLGKRAAVENTFNLGTKERPSSTGAERIRGINANTGQAQVDRDVLKKYDEAYNTNLLPQALRLSYQREWTGNDLTKAYAIDSALQPQRPGFIRGLALPVARGSVRVQKFAGPVAGGAIAMNADRIRSMLRGVSQ